MSNSYSDQEVCLLTQDTQLAKEANYVFSALLEVIDKFAPKIKPKFLELRALVLDAKKEPDIFDIDAFNTNIDVDLREDVMKSFSLYLMLLNIIEERRDVRNNKADLKDTFDELKKEGYSHKDISKILANTTVYPVFTAHPTESRRRIYLQAHRAISSNLGKIFEHNDTQAQNDLRYRLKLLWQSDLTRKEKIHVLSEVENLICTIDGPILNSISMLIDDIESLTNKTLQAPVVRLGSWVGGDRDGNPYVTNEVLTQVMKIQHTTIINKYIRITKDLLDELSISTNIVDIEGRLLNSITQELQYLDKTTRKIYANEPFRLKLFIIKKKLENRLLNINTLNESNFTYHRSSELIDDLNLMISSLDSLSAHKLKEFRNLVLTAGFHLLKLDFREHRDKLYDAVTEIFSLMGVADSDF